VVGGGRDSGDSKDIGGGIERNTDIQILFEFI
jgi:hypothetical protein